MVVAAVIFLIFLVVLGIWFVTEMRALDADMDRLADAMELSHRQGLAQLRQSAIPLFKYKAGK